MVKENRSEQLLNRTYEGKTEGQYIRRDLKRENSKQQIALKTWGKIKNELINNNIVKEIKLKKFLEKNGGLDLQGKTYRARPRGQDLEG